MVEEQLDGFSAAVESIYAAALQPEKWPLAVERIARVQLAQSANLLTPATAPGAGGFIVPYNLDAQVLEEWGTRYIHQDPWTAAAIRNRQVVNGRALLGEEIVPQDELVETEFYRGFLSRHRIHWLCTGVVFDGAEQDLPVTSCSIYNPPDGHRFDAKTRAIHALLTRHLSRALGIMFKLRDTEFRASLTLQALQRVQSPLILIGSRSEVQFANDFALRLLRDRDGIALSDGRPLPDCRSSLIATAGGKSQADLNQLLRQVLDPNAGDVEHFTRSVHLARPGKSSLMVRGSKLAGVVPGFAQQIQTSAILFFTDPDASVDLDLEALTRAYGVSVAEAKVASHLVRGANVTAIANDLGISVATVRTHLSRLFQRTGTSRQPELLKLLLAFVR